MLPINQVILGGTDPLLNTGSLTDQIQYLEEQKRLIEARQKQIQQAANGQQTLQQVSPQQTAKVSVWDLIDAEIEPLTNEQRNMLATNEEYVANYNNLQSMVQAEVLNLVRANIENSPLLMQMLGVDGNERYNDYGDEHFNKQEAKRTVDEMYHVKDGKKYIGEKYDMQKAHEVCSKFKDKLEDEVEVADVYVAINAQYHDYCELFEKWFGKGNFDDMIFESAISFWFDDVDFGEDKLWKYFNELK